MKIEVRNNSISLDGYVNVVGRQSRTLRDINGPFIETIAPNTFAKALDENPNVRLMFNHKRDLNPTKFELVEDNIGLRAKIEIDDSEVVELAQTGKLTGFSFGFMAKHSDWEERNDMRYRTVDDIYLDEVSLLSVTPAYFATSVEMRGEDELLKETRSSEELEIIDRMENNKVLEQLNMKRKRFAFEIGDY